MFEKFVKLRIIDGFYFILKDDEPVIGIDWYDGIETFYHGRMGFDDWSNELDFKDWVDLVENLTQTVKWIYRGSTTKIGYFES